MQIALPKKTDFKKESENKGQIIIEPCFPGYGITLGNALRRVMLSSLPGAAPVGLKIKNVDHEFSAMPHLKEDILEFVLNFKQLRIKMHSNETEKLILKVHGEREIKASDIEPNANVEIINKDLVLGHITSMQGNLEAEIFVKKGMGYESIEERDEKNDEIGYIEIDSIFSPVFLAGVKVENVRVGKMTNWEKLVLTVETDGTITIEEAFNQSVAILIQQFSALSNTSSDSENASLSEDDDSATETVGKENEEVNEDEEKPRRGRPKKE